MGLLDILNSIQGGGVSNDPRAPSAQAGQGMSPMAKALLALLAVYAAKNLRRADAPPTQPAQPPRPAGGGTSAGPSTGAGGMPGGDLGDLLRGALADSSAVLPPERCSTAGSEVCSSSCRRAGRATLRSRGSAKAPTSKSLKAILPTPSAATPSTNCQDIAGWIRATCFPDCANICRTSSISSRRTAGCRRRTKRSGWLARLREGDRRTSAC